MFPDELINILDYCSTIKARPGETDGMVMETSVVTFLLTVFFQSFRLPGQNGRGISYQIIKT